MTQCNCLALKLKTSYHLSQHDDTLFESNDMGTCGYGICWFSMSIFIFSEEKVDCAGSEGIILLPSFAFDDINFVCDAISTFFLYNSRVSFPKYSMLLVCCTNA